jgi:hypothetical protein
MYTVEGKPVNLPLTVESVEKYIQDYWEKEDDPDNPFVFERSLYKLYRDVLITVASNCAHGNDLCVAALKMEQEKPKDSFK